ncbi:hypothetical protein JAAARDRAFT_189598 [Jaapia argillacea MUCL 33604]|uniref:Uncharacterized protein n=1 Tax=Jaapia argillacea MUCL 33604 TaxID=933084 RepID=A0A067QFG2_9AGAM|nr:hypothetical protein JAAARDRAFT_189598 [Jaapia argillacea MUCL 33604]
MPPQSIGDGGHAGTNKRLSYQSGNRKTGDGQVIINGPVEDAKTALQYLEKSSQVLSGETVSLNKLSSALTFYKDEKKLPTKAQQVILAVAFLISEAEVKKSIEVIAERVAKVAILQTTTTSAPTQETALARRMALLAKTIDRRVALYKDAVLCTLAVAGQGGVDDRIQVREANRLLQLLLDTCPQADQTLLKLSNSELVKRANTVIARL